VLKLNNEKCIKVKEFMSFQLSDKFLFLILFISIVGCSGGGGGGGSSSGGGGGTDYTAACAYQGSSYSGCYPTRQTEASHETTEYDGNYGLGDVKASAAYSRELDGSGVKMAVIDSGIDTSHAEFSNKTISGWNYETGNSTLTDGNGHGTFVAGIAVGDKDSNTMHGVAYGVTDLYVYKIFKDNGSGTSDWETHIPDAVTKSISAGVKVTNHSYTQFANHWTGHSALDTKTELEANFPNQITAYRSLASNNVIQVWAAGNAGKVNPGIEGGLPYLYTDLRGKFLVVGDVDTNGKETSYTNRCGVAAAWCIVAPGYQVTSAATGTYGSGYVAKNGTSFAAPHVAGAVAVLIETFPNLSASQIVTRILNTASTTGLTDINGGGYSEAVHGQGMLDLDAATKPIAVLALSTGSNSLNSSTNYSLSSTKLKLSKAFGQNRIINKSITKKTNFSSQSSEATLATFDSFDNATFYTNVLSLSTESIYSPFGINSLMINGVKEHAIFNARNITIYGILGSNPEEENNYTDTSSQIKSLRIVSKLSENIELLYNYYQIQDYYFLSERSEEVIDSVFTYDAFKNPFIGLNGETNKIGTNVYLSDAINLNLFYAKEDYKDENFNTDVKHSTIKSLNIKFLTKAGDSYSLQLGSLNEEDSFLGSKTSGAFRLDDQTKTNFLGFKAEKFISKTSRLLFSTYRGSTSVMAHEKSLFSGFETIKSFSWTFGALIDHLPNSNDSMGFIIHQPLRAEEGSLTLSLPAFADSKGKIYTYNERYLLEPNGREINYEFFYEKHFINTKVKLTSLFIENGGHLSDSPLEKVFMLELKSEI